MKITVTYEIDNQSMIEFFMQLQQAIEAATTPPTYGADEEESE